MSMSSSTIATRIFGSSQFMVFPHGFCSGGELNRFLDPCLDKRDVGELQLTEADKSEQLVVWLEARAIGESGARVEQLAKELVFLKPGFTASICSPRDVSGFTASAAISVRGRGQATHGKHS